MAAASILGVIAVLFVSASSPRTATSPWRRRWLTAAGLRRRWARPREVTVAVIQPRALRGPIALPPVRPRELPAAERAPSEPQEELPAAQLLADIAPLLADPLVPAAAVTTGEPRAEEQQEVTLEPEPIRARPPFHEPALASATARREQPVKKEKALQSPEPDADEVSITQPIEEICEIGIWRGYVKSRFYAGLVGGEGEGIEYALAESQPIRLRGNGSAERTEAVARVHEALVNYLIESGWDVEPPVNGESWYALRFRRAAAPAEANST